MSGYQKSGNLKTERGLVRTKAELEKTAALLEYVAAMADVDLPSDDEEEAE